MASGNQRLGAETVKPGEACVRGETTVHQGHSLVAMVAELERRTGLLSKLRRSTTSRATRCLQPRRTDEVSMPSL